MRPTHYIFNHIPKTGGNTLKAICRSNLSADEISPHLTEPEIRLMDTTRFERYRLISGHFSIPTQTTFCRSRYSMTLMRDPIRRIFSAYTYWRTAPEHDPVTAKAKELSFADFVRYFADSPMVIANVYAHHFAGIGRDLPGSPDSSSLLAAAKYNLSAFNFIGICEDFARSTRLLCRELGWPAPAAIPHENRTSSEHGLTTIDPQTIQLLRERTRLDRELYGYALTLFEARAERNLSLDERGAPRTEANRFVPFPPNYTIERRARIESVSAEWTPGEDSRVLGFTIRFRTMVPIEELSLGVQVNDMEGTVVWGTRTATETMMNLTYETAADCQATFLVQCELPPGLYFATVALSEPRRLGFHDHWIDRAVLFAVDAARVGISPYVRGMRVREFRCRVGETAGLETGLARYSTAK